MVRAFWAVPGSTADAEEPHASAWRLMADGATVAILPLGVLFFAARAPREKQKRYQNSYQLAIKFNEKL